MTWRAVFLGAFGGIAIAGFGYLNDTIYYACTGVPAPPYRVFPG